MDLTNHNKEFEDMKGAATSSNIMLLHSDWNSQFELNIDARKLSCGAMLTECKENHLRPVRSASRTFSPAESRWYTRNKSYLLYRNGLMDMSY